MLLENGANIERIGYDWSLAARNGHSEVVKLLLEKGANIEHNDNNGRAPLSWAARNDHAEVVKLLLEKCATIEHKNNVGSEERLCCWLPLTVTWRR